MHGMADLHVLHGVEYLLALEGLITVQAFALLQALGLALDHDCLRAFAALHIIPQLSQLIQFSGVPLDLCSHGVMAQT